MKRCPQCHRVERDETLGFCRTDGTPLISDTGAVGAEAGTVKFGSAPLSETETRMLSPDITDAGLSPPTSVLDAQRGTTRELDRPKQHKALITISAVIVAGLAISAYFLLSRTNKGSIESVAVMPFVNESGNADLEYLSDGMTESLINNLSQLPRLNVKARSSVFRYKGKEVSPQAVGADLNVHAILNGRLVQRGEELTLYLSLVDTQSENQIWGKEYKRKLTNLVALQTEIVRDVSERLKARLSGADEQKMAKNYTANAEAYQLYLKGRFYWNKRTRQDLQKAVQYFEQAIALDSNYALAYTGLGDAYAALASYGGRSPELVPKARAAALKSLSLDERLAEAHTALGFVLSAFDYDFSGAEREFTRALELNPNNPEADYRYGRLLTCLGRFEEAHARFRRALEADPLSLVINRNYGDSLIYARKYDEGITQLKKTLELDAGFAQAHQSLATAYQIKGRYAESVEGIAKSEEINAKPQNAALIRQSFAKGGWRGFLRLGTGKQGISDLPSQAYFAAACYTELGERDHAFAELNKAYETREYRLVFLKVDPRFDSLRDDPRYQALLKKVGFSQ